MTPTLTRRKFLALMAGVGCLPLTAQALTWQKIGSAAGGANTWRQVPAAAGGNMTWHKLGVVARTPVNLTISANTQNLNIMTMVGGAYVAGKTDVTLTINAGVVVGSSSTAAYALDTGTGWTAGDTITIVNNGYIAGMGGAGGYASTTSGWPKPGNAGGPAIILRYPVTIANGAGYIYSGGGGGAGGANGGGGAGSNPGAIVVLGVAYARGGLTHGATGSAVYVQPGGAGGALGCGGGAGIFLNYWGTAGAGGGGGGANGGSCPRFNIAGGGHGLAITCNGNAITWVSGSARVYGGIA